MQHEKEFDIGIPKYILWYMNTKTLLTVKTDKSLKTAAQEVAEEIGIPLGTLVNSFLKQFVRTKEAHFEISHRPTKALIAAIQEGEKEFASDKLKKMTLEELIKDLKS
jgi:addiction module RelB/DinJ family antitoxin